MVSVLACVCSGKKSSTCCPSLTHLFTTCTLNTHSFLWLFMCLAVSGVRCGLWDLRGGNAGSLLVARGLPSCGAWLQCLCVGLVDPLDPRRILAPRPGIELLSPALQGRFLTTGPPGKSLNKVPSQSESLRTQREPRQHMPCIWNREADMQLKTDDKLLYGLL